MMCRYVLHVPDNLAFEGVAPLLCAGITTYSPLKHYGFDKPGFKLGIVGLGGLGHMGVLQGAQMLYCRHSLPTGTSSCINGVEDLWHKSWCQRLSSLSSQTSHGVERL